MDINPTGAIANPDHIANRNDGPQLSRPSLDDLGVLRVIQRAFDLAVSSPVDSSMSAGRRNAKRSQNWVTSLRNEFLAAYLGMGDKDIRAFCKECGDNKQEFGLNELLHDVCVCRMATVNSRMHGKSLAYVTEVLWQVESEFKSSGNEAIKDFNKLILGSAKQKLFVGPITSDNDRDLSVLKDAAKCCAGEVYVAFAEHPDHWSGSSRKPRLFRFDRPNSTWQAIEIASLG